MMNRSGFLERRSRLLCAVSLIAGIILFMSACGDTPDEGPAFLEIRHIPLYMEGMWADVELFAIADTNFSNPLVTFTRQQIVNPGLDSQNLPQHNWIRIPAQIPDEHRSSTVNVRLRVFDGNNSAPSSYRLEGINRRTIQSGINGVSWRGNWRTNQISLNVSNIPNTVAPNAPPPMGLPPPPNPMQLNNAPALIAIFRVGGFSAGENPIALSQIFTITPIENNIVNIFDNIPRIGVAQVDMARILTALRTFPNPHYHIDEQFAMRGTYEIYMIIAVEAGTPNAIVGWRGLMSDSNLSFGSNNLNFTTAFSLMGSIPTNMPAALALDCDDFDHSAYLAQRFREMVLRYLEEHGE